MIKKISLFITLKINPTTVETLKKVGKKGSIRFW